MLDMSPETINPLWVLVDPLTAEQAAALIAGIDPGRVRFNDDGAPGWFEDEFGHTETDGIAWVRTAFAAVTNAIMAGNLKAKVLRDSRPVTEDDARNLVDMMESGEYFSPGYEHLAEEGEAFKDGFFVKNEPNWAKSMIEVSELRSWLAYKGFRSGYFFPDKTDAPDYLDPKNPRYAPKLAAALRAWQSVTDAGGKHPKQALAKWLREHAAEFSMTDDEGKPNETGIEEAAKVANWQPGGGAPKTPSD